MGKAKSLLTILLCSATLTLAACSNDSDKSESAKKVEEVNEDTVKTFLLYEETAVSEEDGSIGNLYIKTFDSESEKIASNVINGQYEYNADQDSVLFVTEDMDLYEYKKGTDKEKIATNVDEFNGLLSNDYIFYQNEEKDLYIIKDSKEVEKIASSVNDLDLIDSSLYYLDYEGDLNVYNVESRKESSIGTDISYFELLNSDGDLVYLNDEYMLFYKKADEDAIRISSKEVSPSFISQLDDSFVYIATDDDDQVLYQTTTDGSETIKLAADVQSYSIHKNDVIYLTFDENLFMKQPEDDSAFKLASDVSYFTVSDDEVIYKDVNSKMFSVTFEGEKTERAAYAESALIVGDNSIIYENDKEELFIDGKKIATGIDAYALFNNHIAYATQENKLHFVENLGEPIVIEEDLSKFSEVTYQNKVIFSNYLTFDDISGDWKLLSDEQSGYVTIDKDGTITNRLLGTTMKVEFFSSSYNVIEIKLDDDYGKISLEGDILILEDEYEYMQLQRVSKQEVEAVVSKKENATKTATESQDVVTEQAVEVTLDTVPYPDSINTVQSARQQITSLIEGYLETYTNLETEYLDLYIDVQANLFDDQINYMNSLIERGFLLYLDDVYIVDMKLLSATKFSVTTSEDFTIDNPEKGMSETTQNATYTVELINNEFYITALDI